MSNDTERTTPTGVGAGPERSGPGSPGPVSAPVPDGRSRLTAEGIVVRFQGLTAIDDVDFELNLGEIVGLIGPNGAGKTTLVNVLTGFQDTDEGTVTLDGNQISGEPPQKRARRGITRTFQGARLFADMTVLENVQVSGVGQGLNLKAARVEARGALTLLGLDDLADRHASDLSTGQERRLQVARAVAMRPRYLFLDEPAAGLNESESDELLRVITQLPELVGCGVLLIEHDMRVIMGACSRLVVLDNGSVLKVGTPAEVRADQSVIDAYLGS
ncbi:MAG: ABC transporter ATP-binding protein [Actinomycetota bacterium]|nr:ABC transporter ATP-binding protein [Actinomycetota bacterium]